MADGPRSHRHVAKTGDIKDFVITEESGIAKGIRRVIAITGEEARQASHRANDVEARFAAIERLDSKDLDKALKVFDTVRLSLCVPRCLDLMKDGRRS